MTQPSPADSPILPEGKPFDELGCAYKPIGATGVCGKPPTWHVMWEPSSGYNSLTCDEHMALAQRRWVYADRHPMGPDCTMPGALWEYTHRWCVIPDDHPALAVARALNGDR
ncbi:hypothetical protein ACFZDF_30530 [Streptomyces sp. NPDC007910]|uniref:hypothetical protein n=1 Tax=Streptomyces sp. NPDC007910 TaxID=3364790 RepID=UPI0036EEEF93